MIPFYVVTLSHGEWEDARHCARHLPAEALPELRLDLFPDHDPGDLVDALHRRCLVSCRRRDDGGRWEGTENDRLARLRAALQARPAWMDLEWDGEAERWLQEPDLREHLPHTRLLRSVHVPGGVFDLPRRLQNLPQGDAFKWVGRAETLADNARVKAPLAWARDHGIALSAFFMGPKGLPSRCLQGAWGGAFTYAAPDDAPAAAPGQLPLSLLWSWRVHRLHPSFALCGVMGDPVLHSLGPAFHNERFQRAFKDLLYLPLEAATAEEALEALNALDLRGVSLTSPLKERLPALLGLSGPLNTLWRRDGQEAWHGANTDAEALEQALEPLPSGAVLILGDGGVAETSRRVLERRGRTVLQVSRKKPLSLDAVADAAPVGVIQATRLGMAEGDAMPFPGPLHAALPTLRWAVEWIYAETAFAAWARNHGLPLVEGLTLFHAQAEAQSRLFVEGCG